MQKIADGYYKITSSDGMASDQTVFTVAGQQWVAIHGQTRPLVEYLNMGYVFTPLIPATSAFIAALREVVGGFGNWGNPDDYRDELAVLQAILDELGAEVTS